MSVSRPGKERFLARNAEEAKKYAVLRKVALRFIIPAVLLIVIIYIISVLYTRFGSFTITVDKYDVSRYNLCLSETPDFDKQTSRLNARAAEEITNISVHDLPADLDSINGKHNGENYLAYTFYLKNVGENTVTYEYHIFITNITRNLDKAVRIRIYRDGEPVTYAGKCLQNEILMYFRTQKRIQMETSINEAIETDKDGNPLTYLDIICTDDNIVETIDLKSQIERLYYLVEHVLVPREREIIILRYGLYGHHGKTQREVAQKLGISRSYVSRLEKSALNKLGVHLNTPRNYI